MQPGTRAAHAIHPEVREQPAVPPLYQTSVYVLPDLAAAPVAFGMPGHQVYTRITNPNAQAFAAEVARLEEAPAGAAFASGTAALSAALLAAAEEGQQLFVSEEVYGGTYTLLTRWLVRFGFQVNWLSLRSPLPTAENGVLVLESLTNPLARPLPLSLRLAEAKAQGWRVVVDNTFATPCGCLPFALGADLVVHSATKALAGHAQVILGVVVGDRELVARAERAGAELGWTADPFACWLASAGLRTLVLRQARQVENALCLATFLRERREVQDVFYAGLPDSPDRDLLSDYRSPGSVLALRLRGGRTAAERFLAALKLISFAPSLGDVTTTVLHPEETSHRGLPPELRARLGIDGGLLRLSAGVEEAEDLLRDLEQALEAIGA